MGMGDYTQFLSQKGNSISPEDENYIQELLEIASSFRTFDAALDEFIVQKGYTGNLADTDAKVRFIKCKFDEAGIPIEARILKGWFQKHTQAEKRDYAIQFCFAFHMTLEETQDFFRRVYCSGIWTVTRFVRQFTIIAFATGYPIPRHRH